MPRPKLYKNGRRKMTLEEGLAAFLETVSTRTGVPMSELLDELVTDWKERKGQAYLSPSE